MKHMRGAHLVLWGVAFLPLCLACQSTSPPPSTWPPQTLAVATGLPTLLPPASEAPVPLSTTPPQRGGTLQVGGLSEPQWSNPLWADPYDVSVMEPLVFESLLKLDPQDGHLMPGLSESWAIGQSGKVITFTLRSGVTWHDGEPFSSRDVAFTWRAVAASPVPIPHAEHAASVSDILTPEEHTVVVHLQQPDCPALTQLGLIPILPAHLWKASEIAQPMARSALLVGTGPFRFVDWEPGEVMTLTRQADYWAGEAYLDSWTYRRYDTAEALLAAARAGDIGLLVVSSPLESLPALEDGFHILYLPVGESLYLIFNQQRPGLSERTVRHGLALAVDREGLLTQAVGIGELLTSMLPPGHWSLPPDQQPPVYDPDEAVRLLLSHAELPPVTIKVPGGDRLEEDAALLVVQAYRQAGIDARLEVLAWGTYLDRLFHHEFDVALVSHPFPRDPDQSYLWHSQEVTRGVGFNFGSYANVQVDELLEGGRIAEGCSEELRATLYVQLAEVLAQDHPADFLLAPGQAIAVDSEVSGPAPGPFTGLYWNVAQWSMAQNIP